MSDDHHNADSTPPGDGSPSAGGSGAQLRRRDLIKGSLAAAPVILTVKARPSHTQASNVSGGSP